MIVREPAECRVAPPRPRISTAVLGETEQGPARSPSWSGGTCRTRRQRRACKASRHSMRSGPYAKCRSPRTPTPEKRLRLMQDAALTCSIIRHLSTWSVGGCSQHAAPVVLLQHRAKCLGPTSSEADEPSAGTWMPPLQKHRGVGQRRETPAFRAACLCPEAHSDTPKQDTRSVETHRQCRVCCLAPGDAGELSSRVSSTAFSVRGTGGRGGSILGV